MASPETVVCITAPEAAMGLSIRLPGPWDSRRAEVLVRCQAGHRCWCRATRWSGRTADALIIPLLEEVLVVEKRFLRKEELRITTRRVETHRPRRVTLRREGAAVERINCEGDESNPCP